jgi:hypothetical protein
VYVQGQDDNLQGDQLYGVKIVSILSADPEYNHLGLDNNPGVNPPTPEGEGQTIPVINTDNDTAGGQGPDVIITPTSGLVTNESGSQATFTVKLATPPANGNVIIHFQSSDPTEGTVSPTAITFTAANYDIEQTITVTGVDDTALDGDINYRIIVTVDPNSSSEYAALKPSDVGVVNRDNESPGVTVSPTNGLITTTDGGTTQFTVVLNSRPTANVLIPLHVDNPSQGRLNKSSLIFTPTNWNILQTITVTGQDDGVFNGNVTYHVILDPAISSDTNYNGVPAGGTTVTIINIDNNVPDIKLSTTGPLTTTEAGGSASYTVVLGAPPTSDVVIGLVSSDTSEGTVSPPSLTFTSTNYNVPQTVTVTGVDDAIADGDVTYHIISLAAVSNDSNYNGLKAPDVTVVNKDDDHIGVTVSPLTMTLTEGGAPGTFTIVLASQPTANVTIPLNTDLSPFDTTTASIAPTSVTFTPNNWNVPQTVTVTPLNNGVAEGTLTFHVVTGKAQSADPGYNNLNVPDVTVAIRDVNSVGVIFSSTSLTTTENGSPVTFTAKLGSLPSTSVTFSLSVSDPTEGRLDKSSLTFTTANWNTPQTVTVTPVNDFVQDGAIAYTIVTGAIVSTDRQYKGFNPADLRVVNYDDDHAGYTVTPVNLTTTEQGAPQTFTVKLNSQPLSNVAVNIVSQDTTEGVVDKGTLIFTPTFGQAISSTTSGWNVAQTVKVTPVDDKVKDGTITYYIKLSPVTSDPLYKVIMPPSVRVVNSDNDVAGVILSPTSGLVTTEAGGQAKFTARLMSQPVAPVTIAFTSTDTTEGKVAPSSAVFSPENWNVAQTITVTGVDDTVQDGNVSYAITSKVTSSDPVYNGFHTVSVGIVNLDDDDTTPPTISIVQPAAAPNNIYRSLTYATGIASDNKGVAKVTVHIYHYADSANPQAGYVDAQGKVTGTTLNLAVNEFVASGTTSWTFRMPTLATGRYDLTATARDQAGNTKTQTRTFFIDKAAPVIAVSQPQPNQTYTTLSQVLGSVVDAGGGSVQSVRLILFRYANSAGNLAQGYYNGTMFTSTSTQLPITPNSDGTFSYDLPALATDRYYVQVVATDSLGNIGQTPPIIFNLAGPAPTPTTVPTASPTATPGPTPVSTGDQFGTDQSSYLISVPFMDSSTPGATTTVSKAFTKPPVASDGSINYDLQRWDPVTQTNVSLGNNSIITRGAGYFLYPRVTGTSIKTPAMDASRLPLAGTTFDIILRRDSSRSLTDPNNGLNLIGYPFDPALYSSADWQTATFIAPNGTTYNSPTDAENAGLIFSQLYGFDATQGGYFPATRLEPYKGYAVRTQVDGVRLRLRGSP